MAERSLIAVSLRPVQAEDLEIFFTQQLDPEANYMAAFTAENRQERLMFLAHWAKIMADPEITIRTIVYGDDVAGYVLVYSWYGEPEVSYWLGREFWGKGIATQALGEFLEVVTQRPLYGHAAKDNFGSLRVLEKNGFVQVGEDKGFSNARQVEVEEWILIKE